MASTSPGGEARYWLLVGNVPSGPFTVEQVHAKLTAGEITWQSQACRLGSSGWLPLVETPGLGLTPIPEPIPSAILVPPTTVTTSPRPVLTALPADADEVHPQQRQRTEVAQPASAGQGRPRPAPAGNWSGAVFAVLVLAFFGWLGYEWLRPLSPREVCERFDKAKTAKEACRYCTLNLQPAVEEMFRQPNQEHPDDQFEYTQEAEAPADVGGYFVGVRGQFYMPEQRRRMQFDGVYQLIKSDGWKIEDMYCFAVDRQQLPQPISFARDFSQRQGQQVGGQFAQHGVGNGPATTTSTQAKAWYDNRGVQQFTARGVGHFLTSGGGKALGAILCAALVGVLRFGREIFAALASALTGQQGQGS